MRKVQWIFGCYPCDHPTDPIYGPFPAPGDFFMCINLVFKRGQVIRTCHPVSVLWI